MVAEYGMSEEIGPIFLGGQTEVFVGLEWGHERNYSEALAARVDQETQRILHEQFQRAEQAIASDMDALDRVAAMLMQYERVTGEEFAAVYHGADPKTVLHRDQPEEQPEQPMDRPEAKPAAETASEPATNADPQPDQPEQPE